MFTGGNERCEGFRKIEWVDFVECELMVDERVEKGRVRTGAGAEWFQGERRNTALAQVRKEQAGQDCFANTGVGAGDEDEADGKHVGSLREVWQMANGRWASAGGGQL